MNAPVNLAEKFSRFTETWTPKVVAELNGQHVRIAKLEGPFLWHAHDDADELFLVVEGRLRIELRDRQPVVLGPGELLAAPA